MKECRSRTVFAGSILLSLILVGCGNSYPSDSLLEERFHSHRADFERLVTLFKEDRNLSTVGSEAAWVSFDVKANIQQQRLNAYRTLFNKLELKSIGRGEKSGNFYILTWKNDGFIIGGSSKLYIYAETPPSPLVDSLDGLARSGHDAYAFKKIADNWYLHLDTW